MVGVSGAEDFGSSQRANRSKSIRVAIPAIPANFQVHCLRVTYPYRKTPTDGANIE